MGDGFAELNLYVYHSARGAVLDIVIWCLGPFVDDSREYGVARWILAAVMRQVCRSVLGLQNSAGA